MSICADCGAHRGPLCPACTRVADALGHSTDERLRVLGVPRLIAADHERETNA